MREERGLKSMVNRTNIQPEFMRMFVDEVIEEMDNRGISQTLLAKKAGISRATMSRILNGHMITSLKNVELIAKAMNMKIVLCLMEDEG